MFVQYTYSAPVEEYNAMVYVKRRDTFHVDSSPDLYGEVKALVLRCRLDCTTFGFYYFLAALNIHLRVFSSKTNWPFNVNTVKLPDALVRLFCPQWLCTTALWAALTAAAAIQLTTSMAVCGVVVLTPAACIQTPVVNLYSRRAPPPSSTLWVLTFDLLTYLFTVGVWDTQNIWDAFFHGFSSYL